MCLKNSICKSDGIVHMAGLRARQALAAEPEKSCCERQFERMYEAFARTGGLASGDTLAYRLRRSCDQPISMLARWVVNRDVLAFEWRAALRIPLFQFSEDAMTLQPAVTDTMRELAGAYTDWEIAAWFAAPNPWLLDRPPCEAIRHEPTEVVNAARAARFILLG